MNAVITTEVDGVFNLGPSAAGRAAAAVERFLITVPLVMLGGMIFFLPDYFGRLREQEPMPGFLLITLAIVAASIGLVAGALRLFRSELWAVDAEEGMLVYQANRLLGGGVDQTGIELSSVSRFIVKKRAPLRTSGLFVEIDGHGAQRMLETRVGADTLLAAVDELRDFLATHDIDIVVEVGPA